MDILEYFKESNRALICIRSIFFKLEVYHYAHSPLHIHDKIINDTLIMTLACQCNTIATTFCLYRKFRHVLLQNHSCISNDRLSCISVTASSSLAQHLTLIFFQKFQHRAWCLEPSQQQDFSYWSSHRRANSQDRSRISCPTSFIHINIWINHYSQWRPVVWFIWSTLGARFLWELMRFWEQLQPWDETPRAA